MSSPTLADVANACKVSPATVSLVISNNSRIHPATKEKVRKKIRELKYIPNTLARSLAKGRSHVIAVLIPPVESIFLDPFYSLALDGIYTITRSSGYKIILEVTTKNFWLKKDYEKLFADRLIEGVIFLGGLSKEHRELHKSAGTRKYVIVGEGGSIQNGADKLSIVTGDNFKGGYLATKHLIKLGHRKIAHIHGPTDVYSVSERLRGFKNALADARIALQKEWVIDGKFRDWDAYMQTKKIFESKNRPTAIFAGNDIMALGVIKAADETGLKIPSDISLIGMDDIPMAALAAVPLTTVRYPIFDMGSYAAAELIKKIERIDDCSAPKTMGVMKIFDVALIERKTTKPQMFRG